MNDLLHVPLFSRLDDWVGAWLMEPTRFAAVWQSATRMDWARHMAEPLDPRSVAEKIPAAAGKTVAIVRLTGMLMKSQPSMGGTSTIQARRDLRQAAADPDVTAIVLAIDSPGGTVAGTSDLAADVAAARKSKPVLAHIDDLGASAAYWVASQADKITANSPTALIGSIGTLQVVYDQSAAAEKEGIRTLVFRTGPLKGLGTPGAPVTDEQAAHIQSLVDSIQQSFDAGVMKGRGLSASELANVRHGGVMTATAALNARLIDAIQPLSKTIADAIKPPKQTARMESEIRSTNFPTIRHGGLPMLATSGENR